MISVRDAFVRTLDHLRKGNAEEAEFGLRKLVEARPAFAAPRVHLIRRLQDTGRHQEALDHLRALVAAQPEPEHQLNLCAHLLAMGHYAEGWEMYEVRALLSAGDTRPRMPTPEWKGEPVKQLVVWDEQGIGDSIQFARFLPRLQARGVEVTYVCRPPLVELMRPLGVPVVPAVGRIAVPNHDAWAMICSLPHLMKLGGDVGMEAPYLRAPAERAGRFRVEGRIGVVGSGNPRHVNDANRSLPEPFWRRLKQLPGAVSLHPGEVFAFEDFADTAAVIEQLDLVISVDTAVAHLACAMGKPCWVLQPLGGGDWRWMHEGQDSPWYPSARIYRHGPQRNWGEMLDRVEADLAAARA